MAIIDKVAPPGSRRRRAARALRHALRGAEPAKPARTTPTRPHTVEQEKQTLKSSWADVDAEALDDYLVSGFQNPQINAQSILTRHHLIRELFPDDDFGDLMRGELEHSARATRALYDRSEELGVRMGTFVSESRRADVRRVAEVIKDWQDDYEKKWAATLADKTVAHKLRVLEFACGSANDYRYLDRYGIARFLDYTGIDLNDNNIDNARRRYPGVDFQVQNVLELPFDDRSYDYVVVFDLFEHMSIAAMEQALREACRIAGKGLILTFFIMADIPEHEVRPKRTYFFNRLSKDKVQQLLENTFGPVQSVRIADLMDDYGNRSSSNPQAWTMIATRRED